MVGMADVSVLLPLPASDTDPDALRLDAAGRGGPLLPRAMFDAIPAYLDNPLVERAYERWRVVAARIDPCFPSLALLDGNPDACRRQLRLVAQPFGGGPGFGDHAIHLLYDLPAADFDAMATRWLALRTATSSDPTRRLGVHPEVVAQGLGGAVASELRAIITTYAGAGTLAQLTFVEGRGVAWEFGGFMVRAGGVLEPIAIHGIAADADARAQVTTSDAAGVFAVSPSTPEAVGLGPLAGEHVGGGVGGGEVALTAQPAQVRAAMQLSLDVDSPDQGFNPDTIDCASCHLATRARTRALTLGASAEGLDSFDLDGFDLELDLPELVKHSPQQQRAFGYNGTTPVWNQRTINESAAVAAYFATWLDGR